MEKKLENGSKYAQFDMDGDGTVTDTEMAMSERAALFENYDKLQDQQRLMSWFALGLPFAVIVFLSFWASVETINAMIGVVTTYIAGMSTIVVAFMAVSGWAHTRTSGSSE
jgi:ABC-type uncharacterized transport system fused permease/ATPase subunit